MTKKKFITKSGEDLKKFETGAVRYSDDGKPRFDLIPPQALERVAMLYARGAKIYGDRNWEKGIPTSRCYASMLRHAFSYGRGEEDEDHLAAVVWNALAIMQFQEDNRIDVCDMEIRSAKNEENTRTSKKRTNRKK